ncbi:kinase-like domain-containing protein [Blyttiomyces helicus]|uniref:Kinase-like domain-containing protein n=1 Tax=Blyttiomyces helicus TaxID=388810 RepID=A0A4P9WK88_9FUNG|nr:kinase-like domain-containing protein [Blyttiomyces helicus]|eukprot:RKO93224.1 kinase-like domain-containing protein [Blyttiomyces helicus]
MVRTIFETGGQCHPAHASNPLSPSFKKVNNVTYERIEVIGRGGSSKVYKILSPTGKIHALKKVKLKDQDEAAVEGYINEIALLRKLRNNQRIIRLVDAEIDYGRGIILMVLEYGETDLNVLLQKNMKSDHSERLTMNFIRNYWEQATVQAIHGENIIHSDLKPANFLIVGGELKLIDFGIAKAIPNDTTNIHRDYQTGTINYMAPEAITFVDAVAGGSKRQYLKLGRASDVWSLGCILYQLHYGRPPFAHITSVIPKLQCIVDPTHVIDFPAPVDDALREVIEACLARDPRRRPTIDALLAHRFLGECGGWFLVGRGTLARNGY